VGRLAVTPRILAFIVIWLLTLRRFNHAVLAEEYLMVMYYLMVKKVEYRIPYVVLISQFIEYFEIDTEEEVVEQAKTQNEISAVTLNKIRLTEVNDDHWICKADYDSSDAQPIEDDNGGTSVVAEGYDVPIHDVPHTGYENYFAGFEERMMTQVYTMHEEERNHY